MSVQRIAAAPGAGVALPGTRKRLLWIGSALLFGVLPLTLLVTLFVDVIITGEVPVEPEAYYWAAEAVLRGETPYWPMDDAGLILGDGYVYPPLTALGVVPLTVLPPLAAGLLMMAVVVGAVLAIPYVLGVRDWRCYGLLFLWPPVMLGVQTGNVNALLALAAALAWRFRDRPAAAGLMPGIAFAQKLVLWPLAVWMAATRRYAATAWAAVSAAALLLGSWAVIGFAGFADYPSLLRRLGSLMDDRGYSLYAFLYDLGAPSSVARLLWGVLGLSLVLAVVHVARRGDERRSFVLAIAAVLAVTPVAWLHYFVFLVVVVAMSQRSLGLLWFVPLATLVTEGGMNPGPLETLTTMAVVAVTIVLALRTSPADVPPARRELASRGRAAVEAA